MATAKDRAWAIEARERGLSFGQIAKKVGVSKTTIRRWVNPDYAARCRAWADDYKERHPERQQEYEERRPTGRCSSCRGPMSHIEYDGGTCRNCRVETMNFRRTDILRLWNEEEMNAAEIATELRSSESAIQNELRRMRKDGWAVAHRQRPPARILGIEPNRIESQGET